MLQGPVWVALPNPCHVRMIVPQPGSENPPMLSTLPYRYLSVRATPASLVSSVNVSIGRRPSARLEAAQQVMHTCSKQAWAWDEAGAQSCQLLQQVPPNTVYSLVATTCCCAKHCTQCNKVATVLCMQQVAGLAGCLHWIMERATMPKTPCTP